MANRNDYNYYKNEYGKYKESYYSPGSEEYKKRRNNSLKQKIARYARAAVVFLAIVAVVVGLVFGIMAITKNVIGDKKPETTTIPPVESTTVSEEKTTEEVTTEEPEVTTEEPTTAKPEVTTEGSTQTDNSITSYADAMKAFKEKGNGAVMNCEIVGSGVVYAMSKPDASSTKLLYLVAGNAVKVIDISGSYSKVKALGYEGWVPNENLTFVSWAN